jgi:hypothetical protein
MYSTPINPISSRTYLDIPIPSPLSIAFQPSTSESRHPPAQSYPQDQHNMPPSSNSVPTRPSDRSSRPAQHIPFSHLRTQPQYLPRSDSSITPRSSSRTYFIPPTDPGPRIQLRTGPHRTAPITTPRAQLLSRPAQPSHLRATEPPIPPTSTAECE